MQIFLLVSYLLALSTVEKEGIESYELSSNTLVAFFMYSTLKNYCHSVLQSQCPLTNTTIVTKTQMNASSPCHLLARFHEWI